MGGVAYGRGKQALIDAAITIVATQGLRGLTYRAVAAEAGVTQGLVRHHFGDWNSLLEAALEHAVSRSLEFSGLETSGPGLEGLSSAMIEFISGEEEIQAFQYELVLEARRRPELAPVLERVYESYRSAVQRELARNGIDDPGLTWAVFAAIDGLIFQLIAFRDTAATARAFDALRSLLMLYSAGRATS